MVFDLADQSGFARKIEVARQKRQADPVSEIGEPCRAIVKLMFADGHRVIADGFQKLSLYRALVGAVVRLP